MPWLPHPIHLAGRLVRLEPLQETHFTGLIESGADAGIWTHLPFDGSDAERLLRELKIAILNRTMGSQYPFTIIAQDSGLILGSTRFFDIFEEHRKLEIGWTWYRPDAWGKGYNIECKLLLLTYAFEDLGVNRVQLKTRTTNQRSRAAIEKIGAVYEGCLRADRIMPDGSIRDTVVYSFIRDEWSAAKAHLEHLLQARNSSIVA
jgi:RimJ/RimL family protein N-acetyltransferase